MVQPVPISIRTLYRICRAGTAGLEGSSGMSGLWLTAAALNGLVAVAAGAYGSHGLAGDAAAWVEIGSRYQMWHALALLGLLLLRRSGEAGLLLRGAGWAFLVGIALFSFSLYAMALTGDRSLGWITPIGGTAFVLGWAALALHGLRRAAR